MHEESTKSDAPREAIVDEGPASGEDDDDKLDETLVQPAPAECAPSSGVSPPSAPPTSKPKSAPPAQDPLEQARADVARFKDQWIRTAADFDNFRKRARRELDDARKAGREDLLRALLPVFDNLERAMQSAQRSSDVKAMADGLSMVQRQFVDALGREGITRIPTVGHPFDPGVHEAIQQVETSDHAPGTILSEVQPGYVQGERLLRAAMVVVAKAKADAPAAEATDGEAGPQAN